MNVNELPQYKCHKVVRAGKILATSRNPNEDAVFLDVDGTLLDQYQQLPDSTRRALTAAQAAGNLGREAAKHLVSGVYHKPLALHFMRLGGESLHF